MPDLNFDVESAEPLPFAAAPHLLLKVRIDDASADAPPIQAILLRVQVRIEPTRRRHDPAAASRLRDLFGEPERWGRTMRSMLWTHASLIVPPFQKVTRVDLPLPCTFDFNVAATKYFDALDDGEVPLCLLFSGTVFARDEAGLQATPISWAKECTFRLPVDVWRAVIDHYYPGCAWLCLQKDNFDRLNDFRSRHGLPTCDQAIEKLLAAEGLAATNHESLTLPD